MAGGCREPGVADIYSIRTPNIYRKAQALPDLTLSPRFDYCMKRFRHLSTRAGMPREGGDHR